MTFHRAYAAPVNGLFVCLLAISLFWCGDPGCMAGSGFDRCGAQPNAAGTHEFTLGCNDAGCLELDCCCVCHVPMVPAERYIANPTLPPIVAPFSYFTCDVIPLAHSIFRPPRA